jgi:hypothetical protein
MRHFKKLLLVSLASPVFALGQHFEAGLNYGSDFEATFCLRVLKHIKLGVGYEYTRNTATVMLGTQSYTEYLSSPIVIIEYVQTIRRHMWYGGVDFGKVYISTTDAPPGIAAEPAAYREGVHLGYNLRLYQRFYANAQAGYWRYSSTTTSTSGGVTSSEGYSGGVSTFTLGLHYMLH